MRIGLKEGLVEQAIAEAFARPGELIREANMLSGDLGAAAVAAREGTLEKIALRTFQPIHFMLASPSRLTELLHLDQAAKLVAIADAISASSIGL